MTVMTESAFRRCSTKNFSLKIEQYRQESTVLESHCNKVTDLKVCKLIKKRLQQWCFSMNIAKFLRTAFFIEHFCWLLLQSKQKFHHTKLFVGIFFQHNTTDRKQPFLPAIRQYV